MKKYVFFDIDGTLLPESKRDIPQETIDSIKKLIDNGVEVFICTGRCFNQAKKYIEQIGAKSYVVSNGQEVNILGEEIYSYNISAEEKEYIIPKLEVSGVVWGYETRDRIYINDMPGAELVKKTIQGYGLLEVHITSRKLPETIKQMWAFGKGENITKLEENIMDKFKCYRWSNDSLELVPYEESKGKAIKKIMEHSSEKIKTYAFGDGFNDIELLEMVDVGVAMGNARTEVKAVADYITDECENDGITKGLKHLGLI